ncbi:MAG: ORF6C domain-containing protein [Clostridium sp.]|uniref:ORF6C domain-containing protein n=1 Tax=Clostridium sp. TaxID=1506 RepID=UPI00291470C7|nr:ORF6C domain-containing protein [Clostridium sp.]MDU5108857.1 ORF6C domain-containing protein [Clostridium sp.]
MNNKIVKINNTDLSVKEFNGQRVVTFKDIDMLHERVEGTADRNFRENKSNSDGSQRFIEGEDYFVLRKSQNNEIRGLEIPNRGITLVTESGYLMLVKSLQDDLAWKVQRELVNNYFRSKKVVKKLSTEELLELQFRYAKEVKEEVAELKEDFNDFKGNSPLFNIECKELQALVRKIGIIHLGGYKSAAYKDNSLRGRVYADIQHQLKREFGVTRYEAIKRSQLSKARELVKNYILPTVLRDEIVQVNNQVDFEEVI